MKSLSFIIAIIILVVVASQTLYVIDETEQAVITRFGEAIGEVVTTPGLKFKKVPFFDKVNRFPKMLLEWDGDRGQFNTKEKTYIWVDVFARWRIVDALEYFQSLHNETEAQWKLDNIINASVRNLIASYPLIETVRNSNRDMDLAGSGLDNTSDAITSDLEIGRTELSNKILEQASPKLREFGIELVEVQFKRTNYTDRVLKNVFERMIADRKQIAEKFRSEGKGESQKIEGEKEKDLERIYSEARKKAEVIKGEADATAAQIYTSAYGRDPEFYSFIKTLSIYQESLDTTTGAILSTDNEFLKYLNGYNVR